MGATPASRVGVLISALLLAAILAALSCSVDGERVKEAITPGTLYRIWYGSQERRPVAQLEKQTTTTTRALQLSRKLLSIKLQQARATSEGDEVVGLQDRSVRKRVKQFFRARALAADNMAHSTGMGLDDSEILNPGVDHHQVF